MSNDWRFSKGLISSNEDVDVIRTRFCLPEIYIKNLRNLDELMSNKSLSMPESLNRIKQLFIKYKFLCQPPLLFRVNRLL